MKRPTVLAGALIGGSTCLALVALLYLAQAAGVPFVPFDLFDWLARVLPGNLVTLGIATIARLINALALGPTSETAKLIEQVMAILLVVIGGAMLGSITALLISRTGKPGSQIGLGIGLLTFVALILVESSTGSLNTFIAPLGLALLIIGWGWLLGRTLDPAVTPAAAETDQHGRRDTLLKVGGSALAVALAAWGVSRLLFNEPADTGAEEPISDHIPQAGEGSSSTAADSRIEPAPGTRPEVTANEAFYRIDINTRPPVIRQEEWSLEVAGLFDNPRPLTLSELMAYEPVTQPITLGCISNRIGGDLISTSYWTGARLRDVLADLGIQAAAKELFIESEDGFYESVAYEDWMDRRALFVYAMNGETLPVEHGFPLRIYIPNRYGMKQPKWITRIEAIDREGPGYWVERGWSAEARPHIQSAIDTIATDAMVDGRVPIGGIAWAGDRGIQKVEVQVDDSQWVEAHLRTPPLSDLTWVQWRYDWPALPGRHTFRVRATDGTGRLQIEEPQRPLPNGATGYHVVTETIR